MLLQLQHPLRRVGRVHRRAARVACTLRPTAAKAAPAGRQWSGGDDVAEAMEWVPHPGGGTAKVQLRIQVG